MMIIVSFSLMLLIDLINIHIISLNYKKYKIHLHLFVYSNTKLFFLSISLINFYSLFITLLNDIIYSTNLIFLNVYVLFHISYTII